MYLEYYSLDRPPFRITPDPSLFYTGGANGRGVVLEALLYAISSGEGILKVVGEVGSGKTMLCRMLEERLPESVEIVYLANPNLSPHDILYAIAFELKLPVDHSTQRLVLMQHLQEYLLQQHAANKSVLVIIEEAQSMPLETLEEVRLFSNLETHQHKLMQIVLFGQPELDKNLQDKSIRQLRERITHSFDLRPLNQEEVSDYIRFRLQAAGCPAPQVFSDAAEKLIAKASGGLTRRINILADKSMLAAYAESATGQRPRMIDHMLQPVVFPKHVRAAIKDSGYKPAFWTVPRLAVAAGLLLLAVAALAWWGGSLMQAAPSVGAQVSVTLPTEEPVVSPQVDIAVASAPTVSVVPEEAVVPAVTAVDEVQAPVAEVITEDAMVTPAEPGVEVEQIGVAGVEGAASAAGSEMSEPVVAEEQIVVEEEIAVSPTTDEGAAPEAGSVAQVAPEPEKPGSAEELHYRGESSEFPLLAARSEAMRQWLTETDSENYTVQLLSVSSAESAYVNSVLGRLSQAGLLDRTYSCISTSQGIDYWKVVYGDFSTVEQARMVINGLPASLRSNGPYVQSIRRMDCAVATRPIE